MARTHGVEGRTLGLRRAQEPERGTSGGCWASAAGPAFGPAWVLSLGPAYCPTVRDLNTPQASPHGTVVQEYHRSSGVSPVRLATRASIRGPISSLSWKANTTSGQLGRARIRCEPRTCRLTRHPIRNRAARTRLAFVAGHWLTRPPQRHPPSRGQVRHVRGDRPRRVTLRFARV